jgi:hypothetical protein
VSRLQFEVDWLEGIAGPPEEKATSCLLKIFADGESLTRVEDVAARTVRDWARVSAYPLALWFAANWWRLVCEPFPRAETVDLDWRLSHELPSAGGGYVWPPIAFVSDDQSVQVASRPVRSAPFEPVRYIANRTSDIPIGMFEETVLEFINLVLSRLEQLQISDTQLHLIWTGLRAERKDPDQHFRRRVEARMGLDPEQASDDFLSLYSEFSTTTGREAAQEIIATFRSHDPNRQFAEIARMASDNGVQSQSPKGLPRYGVDISVSPWEAGRRQAHAVRAALGISDPVVTNEALLNLFHIEDVRAFNSPSSPQPVRPFGVAIRDGRGNALKLLFRRPSRTSRRFETARFLSESVFAGQDDLWLPATDAATARQKVQRAFAAEFLVPIVALDNFMSGDYSPTSMEGAAEYFDVSPLAIRSHLANNGLTKRF